MHIILVPNRRATARSLNLTPRLMLLMLSGFVVVSLVMALLLARVGVHFGLPLAQALLPPVSVEDLTQQEALAEVRARQAEQVTQAQIETQRRLRKAEDYLRSSIPSMTVKLGEMQAKLLHLDSLSERVAKLSGVNAAKGGTSGQNFKESKGKKDAKVARDGQGGPLISLSSPLSVEELQREIDRLGEAVDERSDALSELESQLMEQRIDAMLLPTIKPIVADRVGSPYGRRVDPIAGVGAMHEGIDFVADQGTRVVASAGGIVVNASYHPQYGKLIEIDHGNEFSSRYAHLSKFAVKVGQVVKRGQVIAASGNTGRSTGPHLHFEVRFNGVSQDPERFLQMGNQLALTASAPTATATAPAPAKSRTAKNKKSR